MGKKDYSYLIGEKRNEIECIGVADRRPNKSNILIPFLNVRCNCGLEYEMKLNDFGKIKKCRGCTQGVESVLYRGEKLNEKYKRIYKIYHGMKRRCNGNSERHRKWYFEKGIKVCNEWGKSFVSFLEWALSNGYSETLTLDRKNGELGYCPENCRWRTQKQQTRNTKARREFNFKGVSKSLPEWEEVLGLKKREIINSYYSSKYPKSVEYIIKKYENKIDAYISDNPHELVEQNVPYK